MLRIIFLAFIFVSLSSNGQSWEPFDSTSIILYENSSEPLPREVQIISFKETVLNGGIAQYSGYLRPYGSATTLSDQCGWGLTPWTVLKMTHPWFGAAILSDGSSIRVVQDNTDTLHFDFTSLVNDTLFILDNDTLIYGICQSAQTETILGFTDSIKRYTLFHLDASLTPIANSQIHGQTLVLGEELGFVTYFHFNSNHPQGEFLTMLGHRGLLAGEQSFLKSDAYDLPIGSVYQVKFSVPYINDYRTYTINNVVDNGNSIDVYRDRLWQTLDYSQGGGLYDTTTNFYPNELVTIQKEELINRNHHDAVGLNTLSRVIMCDGDTTLQFYRTDFGQAAVCYLDSLAWLPEFSDPTAYWFHDRYTKNQCLLEFVDGPFGSKYDILTYLYNGSCEFSTSDLLVGNHSPTTPTFELVHISNSTYQLKGNFLKAEIYTTIGNRLSALEQYQFSLEKNNIYLLKLHYKDQSIVRKIQIIEQ
ncbi:MAG: hypothetical protein QNK23_15115 [Crocinitomicaceae bacterium]|nr:hypothetical protein [Crocinitomicaceae bacterium]